MLKFVMFLSQTSQMAQLGGEELQEDERARDETGTGSQGNINLPSENLVTGILLLKTEF